MKKHYLVYQITNLINQKIYIGIHCTNDLEDGYFGSGANIRKAIKKYGIENFEKEILFDFDNPEEMILKESELIDRKFIARKDVYNIKLGGEGWLTFDSVSVKDSEGNCFRVHKTDERYLSGELIPVSCGLVTVKDKDGKTSKVSIDNPDYLNGILIPNTKGRTSVVDSTGRYYNVDITDYRYISGEFQHVAKNRILTVDQFGKRYMVYTNDIRLISGELSIGIGAFKGKKHTNETKKKLSEMSSIHQSGSGNSQYGTCWIHNLELKENKKIKKEEIDLFLSKGWIKGRKIKF